jgi:aspartate/tyrosine/aromatic aminotransferase
MLTNLQQPADALLALIKLHNADPREDKIDLGVGVYRTDTGATPVFAAVKAPRPNCWKRRLPRPIWGRKAIWASSTR